MSLVSDLFNQSHAVPLAEALRPATLDEVIGQQHLLGVGKPLTARLMTFDALAMTCRAVPLPEREPDCPVCGEHPTITTLDPARYIQPACGV